ncbi:hypothetical protein AGMMS49592_4970 [Endomicrobiia bacterium]|nr:hypothetical protein AGMMS49592_4970 [Endomicrobiia bacterium]
MRKSLLVFCSFFALSIFAPAVAQADPVYFVLERRNATAPSGENENAVHGTFSGAHNCATLENSINLMPRGTYPIVLTKSGKLFGADWPEIKIPGHKDVRIHAGNVPEDSEGCILPGRYVSEGVIADSRAHMSVILELIRGDRKNGSSIEIK